MACVSKGKAARFRRKKSRRKGEWGLAHGYSQLSDAHAAQGNVCVSSGAAKQLGNPGARMVDCRRRAAYLGSILNSSLIGPK